MNQDVFEQDGLPLKEGQLFLPGKGGTNGAMELLTGGQTVGKGSNVVDGKRQVVS